MIDTLAFPCCRRPSNQIDFQKVALVHLIDLQTGVDLVEQMRSCILMRGLSGDGRRVLALDTAT